MIMKRLLCVILCLAIVFSIAFQCSFHSAAIAGVDDAVVIGVCLELLALGISIYSVNEFSKSPEFRDFCNAIGDQVARDFRTIVDRGTILVAAGALAWHDLTSWVKSKFNGGETNKEIEFDVTETSEPASLTLKDGTTCPYGQWMTSPFFIYRAGTTLYGFNCTGADVGAYFLKTVIQINCVGTGKVNQYRLTDGASEWSLFDTYNMTYGTTYMGETGSVYSITYANNADMTRESIYLYRTMNRIVNMQGEVDSAVPPAQTVPETETTTKAVVHASSDAMYYPGAVDAPPETIAEGDYMCVEVPEELVVTDANNNPAITSDIDAIATTIGTLNPTDVRPKVYNNTYVNNSTVINNVIADTPAAELQGTGTIEGDIEIANKFRLPKSFLEGFPFSIPYSIFVGIQSFIADPQAPSFDIPFSISRLGIDETVSIDLTQWDPVARLCRALLSVVWVAGLAMACSKFIKR